MNPFQLIPPGTRRRIAVGAMVAIVLLMIAIASFMATRVTCGAPLASYGHSGPAVLPDPDVTPGIVRTISKSEVCGGGSTKHIRKPGIQAVYPLYGAVKSPGKCCEIDHLIPLELGGDNGAANEWPQPYEPRPGAHEKDAVENFLHREVCAGRMDLQEAQRSIATDWYAVYLRMNLPPRGSARAD